MSFKSRTLTCMESSINIDDSSESISVHYSVLIKPLEQRLFKDEEGIKLRIYSTESIVLCGHGILKVLEGEIHYMGAILTKNHSNLSFFAPETHALYSIYVTKESSALVLFKSGHSKWNDLASRYHYNTLWSCSKLALKPEGDDHNLFPLVDTCSIVLQLSQYASLFHAHPLWQKSITTIMTHKTSHHRLSIFLIGAKSSGKSTFVRYCINQLLTETDKEVVVLDLDPGQSEIGPPGLVSAHHIKIPLLGPSFTHMNITPYRCEFLASLSPSDCPKKYLHLAHRLIKIIHTEVSSHIPIIVNTMGWITGLGLEFIQALLGMIKPTHVISLVDLKQSCDFLLSEETHQFINTIRNLIDNPKRSSLTGYRYLHHHKPEIIPIPSRSYFSHAQHTRFYSPKDLRFLCYSAYFTSLSSESIQIYHPIDMIVPYEFPFSRFPYVHSSQETILLEYNCSIIALYIVHEKTETRILEKECVGLGFIRAIDISNSSFHIITPIDSCLLQRISHFEKGYQMNISPMDYSDAYTNAFAYKPLSTLHNSPALGTTIRKPRHNMIRYRNEG